MHLLRNLLSYTPICHRAEVDTHAKRIYQANDLAEAHAQLAAFVRRFEKSASKAARVSRWASSLECDGLAREGPQTVAPPTCRSA